MPDNVEIVEMPTVAAAANVSAGGTEAKQDAAPEYGEDLMVQFGLGDVLNDLRSRNLRSSFSHYISEIDVNVAPLKPRCPAGSLMEIAQQPIDEDKRRLELFDDRVLRNALTLKESTDKVPLPEWLEIDQPWGDEDRKKRRKRKKDKKKKKKKRKRSAEDGANADGNGGAEEGRERKKRR